MRTEQDGILESDTNTRAYCTSKICATVMFLYFVYHVHKAL